MKQNDGLTLNFSVRIEPLLVALIEGDAVATRLSMSANSSATAACAHCAHLQKSLEILLFEYVGPLVSNHSRRNIGEILRFQASLYERYILVFDDGEMALKVFSEIKLHILPPPSLTLIKQLAQFLLHGLGDDVFVGRRLPFEPATEKAATALRLERITYCGKMLLDGESHKRARYLPIFAIRNIVIADSVRLQRSLQTQSALSGHNSDAEASKIHQTVGRLSIPAMLIEHFANDRVLERLEERVVYYCVSARCCGAALHLLDKFVLEALPADRYDERGELLFDSTPQTNVDWPF